MRTFCPQVLKRSRTLEKIMLILVGLGLWNSKDISIKGYEEVKKADVVYIEFYTSQFHTSIESLSQFFGKDLEIIGRRELEEESEKIISKARENNVVILVPGDPMIATTHIALKLEAEKLGIKTKIINGISIINSVCSLTGLHFYRFGKSGTISWIPSKYPLDILLDNLKIDAHTLFFLDLHPKPMEITSAIKILGEVSKEILDLYAVGIARAGSNNPTVKCDKAKKLLKYDFGPTPHCIVFIAKTLHFIEFECLRKFADAPKELSEIVK